MALSRQLVHVNVQKSNIMYLPQQATHPDYTDCESLLKYLTKSGKKIITVQTLILEQVNEIRRNSWTYMPPPCDRYAKVNPMPT